MVAAAQAVLVVEVVAQAVLAAAVAGGLPPVEVEVRAGLTVGEEARCGRRNLHSLWCTSKRQTLHLAHRHHNPHRLNTCKSPRIPAVEVAVALSAALMEVVGLGVSKPVHRVRQLWQKRMRGRCIQGEPRRGFPN